MNYKLITDAGKLDQFVDWLPELRPAECFYLVVLARNKYVRDNPDLAQIVHIRTDKQQIGRVVCNSKKTIASRIAEFECELGSYKTKDGVPIPQEALAVYITPNPRSHIVAAKLLLKQMADRVTQGEYNGYRVDQDAISCVQNAVGHKVYLDIDFDNVDLDETMQKVAGFININCVAVLRTRGGFHLLIKLDQIEKAFVKTWYNNITKLPGADVKGDNLIPVPGCSQGGFTPYMVL